MRQVGPALPSRREMPSLLQSSHPQTETHVHGEIVRRRIGGRAGRAVGEITGVISIMNRTWAQFIPLQLCSRSGL